MTETIADASRGSESRLALSALRFHPLVMVLLLAAAIRLPLAFWPNVIHADEIFQSIEPAWRILGHDGIISWEWRYGIRGWLLPSLLAGPVGLGDWLAPGGTGAFVAPRLAVAMASLSIVASAWALGDRISRSHAIIAAFVTAIWFELVCFAPHTLSEPLATAVMLPAAVLLTKASLTRTDLLIGGGLLGLAFLFRFQYAPAIAVLGLGVCWRQWRNLAPLIAGGSIALVLGGVTDAAQGAVPFAWLIANLQQNLLYDRSAEFGVAPATAYLANFWTMWSAALGLMLLAIWQGRRHASPLLAMAVTNIAVHSLIGHKEYRFIFLSVTLLVILAALGTADWIIRWRGATGTRRSWPLLVAASGWTLVSAALAATGTMPIYWTSGADAAQLAARLNGDPALCGAALYDIPFFVLPERNRLTGRSALYAFHPADSAATGDIAAVARKSAPAFNRIIALHGAAPELPSGFALRDCTGIDGVDVCIFARAGGCDATAAARFDINDVLERVGIIGSRGAPGSTVDQHPG